MSCPSQLPLHTRETVTSIPWHLRYTRDHEWLVVDERNVTVGITAFAAQAFGDAVNLRLPEVGTVSADDPGVVNAAPCTGGRLFRSRVENIAGALSADACAAHCATTQGDR